MSEIVFETMTKEASKLALAIYGPSGSGKTVAAIKAAMGIRDKLYPGQKLSDIGLIIDTEKRSSTKSLGRQIGDAQLETLELYDFKSPFDIVKLVEVVQYAISVGKKIIIIDSYTAFWSGESGLLDRVAEIEVSLGTSKKMYGAWSESEVIKKKNILKNIMSNSDAHIIVTFRAKTEYVIEQNSRGKAAPRAIGLKEDMQADVRYEFDSVLSIDKETHGISVVKDRIGYSEIRETSENPDAPFTIEDGKTLATLVSEGLSPEAIVERKRKIYVDFILKEKDAKSSKITRLETGYKQPLTTEFLATISFDGLQKIVKYLK